jgi:hypothetical protein
MVFTTSQPAIIAPDASKIAAITIAQPSVIAFAPTAGHILFATSFAPIFIAIYNPRIQAKSNTIPPSAFPP